MSYLTYATINSLEEFGFIAGTDYLITFNVFEENGITPLDMGGATIKWALAPYGQTSYNVLQLDGVITDVGVFTVTVPSASTETFSGKYIHQVIITSFAGSEYRPGQGVLLISPRIAAPSLEPSYSITGTTAGLIAETIHAAPTKVTPVDADEIPLWNSVGSVLANVNWANLKATLKTYFDVLYAGVVNTLVYKGVIDCSTNPNYPAADAGHVYVISVTGKIGGASGVSVDAGDIAICNTDGTASGTQAAVGAYWNIVEKNIAGAVTGPATATDGNLALFDGTTGKIIKLGSPPPANEAGAASNFITAYNSATGAFSKAQPTWANIDKTVSSIADITTKSHTALSDIGTNTHAQIDTFIGTTVPATYLPLAGGTMVGNVIYNDNVSVLLGTGSDGELFHDGTNTYFQNNTGHIYIENDTSDGDIIFKVNDGGVDTTVMTIDGATSNVGIGTTGPSELLHLMSSTTAKPVLRIENTNADNNPGSIHFVKDSASPATDDLLGQLSFYGDDSGGTSTRFATIFARSADVTDITEDGSIHFKHFVAGTDTEVMTLVNGNVGIGTTGPLGKLHVASYPVYLGDTNDGTVKRAYVIGTQYNHSSEPEGYMTIGGAADSASDNKVLFGGGTSGYNAATQLSFYTAANNTTRTGTERVRIDSSGNVGIGTTSPNVKLNVVGGADGAETTLLELRSNYATANTATTLRFGNSALAGMVNGAAEITAIRTGTGDSNLLFRTASVGPTVRDVMYLQSTGNVGIGTTGPTNLLSLGGNAAQIFWMERHTTANTAGNTLTITAGGATAGATDKAGGALLLQGGLSTGSAESGVKIYGVVAGASGTADRTQTVAIQVLGNKLGFYAATPVTKPTGVAVDAAGIHAALVSLGLIAA